MMIETKPLTNIWSTLILGFSYVFDKICEWKKTLRL